MPFIVRDTGDDFQTLLAINAMEQAGATVVAITPKRLLIADGAMAATMQFQVWARITDDEHIERVDRAISKTLE